MAILDNGKARGLSPAGRCVFKWGEYEIFIQVPFIPDKLVKETVKGAIKGEFEAVTSGHDVTIDEVLTWALDHDTGRLNRDRLFDEFGPRGISHGEITKMLQEIEQETTEEKPLIVQGLPYTVAPARGNQPRRLIAVTEIGESKE